MRSVFGQASDSVAIKRTTKQKELLIRELKETMERPLSAPLRSQLKIRIETLQMDVKIEKINEERRAKEKEEKMSSPYVPNHRSYKL